MFLVTVRGTDDDLSGPAAFEVGLRDLTDATELGERIATFLENHHPEDWRIFLSEVKLVDYPTALTLSKGFTDFIVASEKYYDSDETEETN